MHAAAAGRAVWRGALPLRSGQGVGVNAAKLLSTHVNHPANAFQLENNEDVLHRRGSAGAAQPPALQTGSKLCTSTFRQSLPLTSVGTTQVSPSGFR